MSSFSADAALYLQTLADVYTQLGRPSKDIHGMHNEMNTFVFLQLLYLSMLRSCQAHHGKVDIPTIMSMQPLCRPYA